MNKFAKGRGGKMGFTLIELVVVLAMIGVLTAVAVPTFSGIVDKARLSADIQLARSGNAVLEIAQLSGAKPVDGEEVKAVLRKAGIQSTALSAKEHALYWVSTENELVVCDMEAGQGVFPERYEGTPVQGSWVALAVETPPEGETGGHTDNARLSQLSGAVVEQEGYVTTQMIDLSGYDYPIVIRTQGVDFRTGAYPHCCYGVYSAPGHFAQARLFHGNAQTSDADGYEFTLNERSDLTLTHKNGGKYIRLCGYGSAADLVITIGQSESGAEDDADGGENDAGEENDGGATGVYTNQLPIAMDTDGGVYNGCGYKSGCYISTSTLQERPKDGVTVTGYIPLRGGQTVRVKDFELSSNYALYDVAFQPVRAGKCSTVFREESTGVMSWTCSGESVSYIRLSGVPGAAPVITVDEKI